MDSNVDIARAYLRALESGASGEELRRYLADDIVYEELPNRLFPNGRTSTIEQMETASAKGKEILNSQHFEVLNAYTDGDTVILEVEWSASLKIPFGTIPAGKPLRDRSAIVLKFRDGRIVHQRNYDCYDPW